MQQHYRDTDYPDEVYIVADETQELYKRPSGVMDEDGTDSDDADADADVDEPLEPIVVEQSKRAERAPRDLTREHIEVQLREDFQTGCALTRLMPFVVQAHVLPVVTQSETLRKRVPCAYKHTTRTCTVVSEKELHAAMHVTLRDTLLQGVPELFVAPFTKETLHYTALHVGDGPEFQHAYSTTFRRMMLARSKAATIARVLNDTIAKFREAAADLQAAQNALFWQQVLAFVARRRRGACCMVIEKTRKERESTRQRNKELDMLAQMQFRQMARSVRLYERPLSMHAADVHFLKPATIRLQTRDLMALLERCNHTTDYHYAGGGDSLCACYDLFRVRFNGVCDRTKFRHMPPLFCYDDLFPVPRTTGSAQSLVWTYAVHDHLSAATERNRVQVTPLLDHALYDHRDYANFWIDSFHSAAPRLLERVMREIPSRAPDASFVMQTMRLFLEKNAAGDKVLGNMDETLNRDALTGMALRRIDETAVSYHYAYKEAVRAVATLGALHKTAIDRVDEFAMRVQQVADGAARLDVYPLLQNPYSYDGGVACFFPSHYSVEAAVTDDMITAQRARRFALEQRVPSHAETMREVMRAYSVAYGSRPASVKHLAHACLMKHSNAQEDLYDAPAVILDAYKMVEQAIAPMLDRAENDAFGNFEKPTNLSQYLSYFVHELLGWRPWRHDGHDENYDPMANAVLAGTCQQVLMRGQREWSRCLHRPHIRRILIHEALGVDCTKRRPSATSQRHQARMDLWDLNVPGLFLAVMHILSGTRLANADRTTQAMAGIYAGLAVIMTPFANERVARVYYTLGRALLGSDCNGRLRPAALDHELVENQMNQLEFMTGDILDASEHDEDLSDAAQSMATDVQENVRSHDKFESLRLASLVWKDFLTPEYNHPESAQCLESIHFYTMAQYDFNRTFWGMLDVPETRALRRTRVVHDNPYDTWRPEVIGGHRPLDARALMELEFSSAPALQPHAFDPSWRGHVGPDFYDVDMPQPRVFAAPCAYEHPYRAGRVPLLPGDTYICDDNGTANLLTQIVQRDTSYVEKDSLFYEQTHGTRLITAPYPGAFQQVRRGDFIVIRVAPSKREPRRGLNKRAAKMYQKYDLTRGFVDEHACTAEDYRAWAHSDKDAVRFAGTHYCYVAVVHAVFPHAHISVPLVNDDEGSFRTGALLVSRNYHLNNMAVISDKFVEQVTEGRVPCRDGVRAGTVHTILGTGVHARASRESILRLTPLFRSLHEAVLTGYPGAPAGYFRSAATRQLIPHFDRGQEALHVARASYTYQRPADKEIFRTTDNSPHYEDKRMDSDILAHALKPLVTDPRMFMNLSCGLLTRTPHLARSELALSLGEMPQEMRIVVVTMSPERLAYMMYGVPFAMHYATEPDSSHWHRAYDHTRVYFGLPYHARTEGIVNVHYAANKDPADHKSGYHVTRRKKVLVRPVKHLVAKSKPVMRTVDASIEELIARSEVVAAEHSAPMLTEDGEYLPKPLDAVELDTFSFQRGDVVLFRCRRGHAARTGNVRELLRTSLADVSAEHPKVKTLLTTAQTCAKAVSNAIKTYHNNDMLFHAVGIVDQVHPDAYLRALHTVHYEDKSAYTRPCAIDGDPIRARVERVPLGENIVRVDDRVYERLERNVCSFAPNGLRSITQEGMSVERLLRDYIGCKDTKLADEHTLFVMDPHIDALRIVSERVESTDNWLASTALAYAFRHISCAANVDLMRWWNAHRRLWQHREKARMLAPVVDMEHYAATRDAVFMHALIRDLRTTRGVSNPRTCMKLCMRVPRLLPRNIDHIMSIIMTRASRKQIHSWATFVPIDRPHKREWMTLLACKLGPRIGFAKPKNSAVPSMHAFAAVLEDLKRNGRHVLTLYLQPNDMRESATRNPQLLQTLQAWLEPLVACIPPLGHKPVESRKHCSTRLGRDDDSLVIGALVGKKRAAAQQITGDLLKAQRCTAQDHGVHPVPGYMDDERMRRLDALDFALSSARHKQYVHRQMRELEKQDKRLGVLMAEQPSWCTRKDYGLTECAMVEVPSEHPEHHMGRVDRACWYSHYADASMVEPWYRTPLMNVMEQDRLKFQESEVRPGVRLARTESMDLWELISEAQDPGIQKLFSRDGKQFWEIGYAQEEGVHFIEAEKVFDKTLDPSCRLRGNTFGGPNNRRRPIVTAEQITERMRTLTAHHLWEN